MSDTAASPVASTSALPPTGKKSASKAKGGKKSSGKVDKGKEREDLAELDRRALAYVSRALTYQDSERCALTVLRTSRAVSSKLRRPSPTSRSCPFRRRPRRVGSLCPFNLLLIPADR